ncbi:Mycothiol acetyltransferase [Pseudovibrio sp. Ad46]|uniref:GNAT family N-acetyltransferase n=1 Tax=Pseudovibrio sp. Ad46 TaxID=989432 RepID=UPI0007B1C279|nr:GNAT family N-acetyltransferase [Pseudovibrio sp. Ad46]KZK86876.1 Mycothiol acetyltransferase [Pseudovibrio sp. Ad46]
MVSFRRASEFSLSQLHQVMVLAFSDYVIQMDMPLADFERMIMARGFDAELSWVATDNEQLVGFWFIGKQGAYPGTIYAVSTGTVLQARGKGIASRLFAKVEEHAARQGYHHVQLEVITSNTAAVKAYEKLGFQTKRNFQCFSLHKAAIAERGFERTPVSADWAEIETKAAELWECAPSWQNTAFAIRALAEGVATYKIEQDGQLAAYIAFTRKTGAVMQIAVAPDYRRQGHASALLKAAFDSVSKDALTFINVDEGDGTIMQALSKLGATKTLQQYEMHRALQTNTAHGQESMLTTP